MDLIDRISVVKGDISQQKADAIVNAANTTLLGGGGVDGAIHRAAGPALLEECRKLNGCATGQAKLTPGYLLPAKYIIHTVGPVWHGGTAGEPALLASCYRESLKLAADHRDIETVAFPAISCGIYGYPMEQAVKIALNEVVEFLSNNARPMEVIFVCFDDDMLQAYQLELNAKRNKK